MARRVSRGELWLYTFKRPDKRRPVLILSRDEVIDLLTTVNLDHLQTVAKDQLRTYIGRLDQAKMRDVCPGLGIALGCR